MKGTDKILTMFKSIPGNLEDQLCFCCAKLIHIFSIISAITLDINTSQISSFYSAIANFIIAK